MDGATMAQKQRTDDRRSMRRLVRFPELPTDSDTMNDTNASALVGKSMKQNAQLRNKLEGVRGRLQTHLSDIKREVDQIDAALKVEYTDWIALLKWQDLKWVCIACVNIRDIDDDTPDDFDLALPIPSPESIPEWNGW